MKQHAKNKTMKNNTKGTVTIQLTKNVECCYSGNKITKGEEIVIKGKQLPFFINFLNTKDNESTMPLIVWETSKNGNPIVYNYELTQNNFIIKSINR